VLSSLNDLQRKVARLESRLLPSHVDTSRTMPQLEPHFSDEQKDVKILELREATSADPFSDVMFDNLFDRVRIQFLLQDWHALAAIDLNQICEHKDRAKLALLSAIGLAKTTRLGEAQSTLREALSWGCSPKLAASLLVFAVHDSLAKAQLALGQPTKAQQHDRDASEISPIRYPPRLSVPAGQHESVTPNLPAVSRRESTTGDSSTFFIKRSYIHRNSYTHFDDTPLRDEYQDSVYRHARALADRENHRSVFDIGCGSGFKLIKHFSDLTTVGSEIEPTLEWLRLTYPDNAWILSDFTSPPPFSPDLVVCSDVIEHLVNPNSLLQFIASICFKHLLLSTPERDAVQMRQVGYLHDGPPQNPSHVREWSFNELRDYLSQYFRVIDHLLVQNPHESRADCQVIVCTPLG